MLSPAAVRPAAAASGWHPCPGSDAGAECTELEVPLDHADADAPLIRLPVRRLPVRDPDRRIGTLLVIAGGPGQRGTDLVQPRMHSAAILERFDVVSWDPRGTSGETLIDCIPAWEPYGGVDRTPDTRAERRALDERIASLARRCRASHAWLLPYIGTLQTALDLEHLRRMLGEPRISLLGLSYGSRVALTYATLFPHRVRAVVLDGYDDPGRDPAAQEVEQAAAFEAQLDGLLADCAEAPACPLHAGGHPGRALDQLLAALDEEPVETGDGRLLTQSDAYEAIAGSLIRDRDARWRLLDALAVAGYGDGGPLLDIATDVRRDYELSGLTQGAFMAIVCADSVAYWRSLPPPEVERVTQRIHEVAPRLGRWLWSPPASPDLPPVGLCAMQPAEPPAFTGPVDAAGAGPVLVLATSGDPTTPLGAAERARMDLDEAALLTSEAERHLSYPYAVAAPDDPMHRCLLDIVEAYLVAGAVPPSTVACP